jgi:hypothetical protein
VIQMIKNAKTESRQSCTIHSGFLSANNVFRFCAASSSVELSRRRNATEPFQSSVKRLRL